MRRVACPIVTTVPGFSVGAESDEQDADVDSDSDDGSYVYGSPSDSDTETETDTASDRSKETSTSESARGKRLAAAMELLNELYPAVDPDPEQLDCETVLRMFRVGAAGDFMLVDESESERLDSEED